MEVLAVVRAAALRAVEGKGPTLVEVVTQPCQLDAPRRFWVSAALGVGDGESARPPSSYLEREDILDVGEGENLVARRARRSTPPSPSPNAPARPLPPRSSMTSTPRCPRISAARRSPHRGDDEHGAGDQTTRFRTEMKRDDRVVVLGEDVGRVGGVFRVTQGLWDEFGDERVIDHAAVRRRHHRHGDRHGALRPRSGAEIQFADFIFPGYDQIVSELAKMRWRSGASTPRSSSCARRSRAATAALYHSQSPESLFIHVAAEGRLPSNPHDAKGLLLAAIRDPDPVALLRAEAHLPRREGRGTRG